MKDRISTKILPNGATRYGVYDEEGSLLRYEYIKLEDEPSTEGDLFCKANMLPDTIPQLLGLAKTNPQVKDVLGVLPEIGNLHIWKKTRVLTEAVPAVPAGYTLGEVEENVVLASRATSVSTVGTYYYYYGDSVSVANDGTVNAPENDSWKNLGRGYTTSETIRSGPLFVKGASEYISSSSGKPIADMTTKGLSLFYIPSGGTLSLVYDSSASMTYIVATKYQAVIGYAYTPEIPAGTHVEYLASTDENAYRESSNGSEAYYTLGNVVNEVHGLGGYRRSLNQSMYISSNVSVSEDGMVTMESPTSTSIGANGTYDSYSQASTLQTAIVGKFVKLVSNGLGWYGSTPQLPLDVVLYIPSDASVSIIEFVSDVDMGSVSDAYAVSSYQPVTGHAAVPADTTTEYLGQLGEGARIETGSYVGTGTYGSSNPNSLTFGFVPKIVLVQGALYEKSYILTGIFVYPSPASDVNGENANNIDRVVTWSSNGISWYSTAANYQLNRTGVKYYYIAVG